jgi:superfamily II DNA or RNA helicase
MPPRHFSTRQRAALFAAAGGVCERCGDALHKGWHADHRHPWSRGGATDLVNGQALCARCNLEKGDTMEDPRERWQSEAAEGFSRGTGDYLITACPGAGKTRAALRIARGLADEGRIEQVLIVAPTRRLKTQWREAAHGYGFDITTEDDLPRGVDGAVLTYARLARNPGMYRVITGRRKTLVILDEVHHASEQDNTSWGPALVEAFEHAERRLLLSGTPFRSDGRPIPFVSYDGNGMAVPGTAFGYGEAVAAQVCRPLRFEVMNGHGEWLRGNARTMVSAKAVAEKDRGALLSALYKADGAWIASVLREADDELTRMREEKPDAGGLVVAQDIATAKAYAHLLASITGQVPAVVHSEEAEADAALDGFASGGARWLVSVAMVSEGADIPRLSVLVFASKVATEMWFRQVMGRVVRMDATGTITATAYIPAVPDLVGMANRIEEEADAGLSEQIERLEREGGQQEFDIELSVPLGSSQAERDQVILAGAVFTSEELARARALKERIGGSLSGAHDADLVRLLRTIGTMSGGKAHVRVAVAQPASGDQLRKALRARVSDAVRSYAHATGQEYSHIHSELNRSCGERSIRDATVETLQKRLTLLARRRGEAA